VVANRATLMKGGFAGFAEALFTAGEADSVDGELVADGTSQLDGNFIIVVGFCEVYEIFG